MCLAAWVLWLGLGLGHGAVSQAWGQNHKSGLPPDLQALIDEALQANPEIKQMRGQYHGLQRDHPTRRGPG